MSDELFEDSEAARTARRELVSKLFRSQGTDLAYLAQLYFERFDEIDPLLQCDVRVGLYVAYDEEKRRPMRIDAPKVERDFDFKYFLAWDPAPVVFDKDDDDPAPEPKVIDEKRKLWSVDTTRYDWVCRYDAWKHSDDWKADYLLNLAQKGDAVNDGLEDLERTEVPGYMHNLTKLGRELRREVYGGHLKDVTARPVGVPDKFASSFVYDLAATCTYDGKGRWYSKWKGHKPDPARQYDALTDQYMKLWFRELYLIGERQYVIIQSPHGLSVFLLGFEGEKDLRLGRSFWSGLPASELFSSYSAWRSELNTPAYAEKARAFRWRVTFLFSVHGAEADYKSPKDPPPPYRVNKGHKVSAVIVDPQRLVEEANATKDAGKLLSLEDEFDWFVELVAERFPTRFYTFDLDDWARRRTYGGKWLGAATDDPRSGSFRRKVKKFLLEGFDEAAKQSKTPIDKAARADLEKRLDDPRYLTLPQGLPQGDLRFVGLDETDNTVYMRNLATGHLQVWPADEFVEGMEGAAFYNKLGEELGPLIPILTFLAFAAMTAVSFGLGAGGLAALSAQGIRQYVTKKAIKAAAWHTAKQFAPAFAALAAQIVLYIIDNDDRKDSSTDRWRAFCRGFFEGYVIQTIYDHLQKRLTSIAYDGPKEYKAILAAKKFYLAMDKLHGIYADVREEMDEAGVRAAVDNFREMAVKILRGSAMVLTAMYYVPHDQALPILDLLGRGADGEPPDDDQWELEAAGQLTELAKALDSMLRTDALDTVDKVMDLALDKGKYVVFTGILLKAFKPYIWLTIKHLRKKKKTTGGADKEETKPVSKRKKVFYVTAIAAVALLAGYKNKDDLGKLYGEIEDLMGSLYDAGKAIAGQVVSQFPGRDEKEAELFGQLVGNLLGGFVLNRNLGDLDKKVTGAKAKAQEKLKEKTEDSDSVLGTLTYHSVNDSIESGFLSTLFTTNLKHGIVMPIIKVIFKRYLSLYNRLVKDGVFKEMRGEGAITQFTDEELKEQLKERGFEDPDIILGFRTDGEKGMSLRTLGLAVVRLHTLLEQDTRDFFKGAYGDQYDKLRQDLKASAELSAELGLTRLVEENLPMAFHNMQAQLRVGLGELVDGLRALFAPFKEANVNGMSWIHLLKELGLDVGPVNELQHQLLTLKREELADFRKVAAPAP